MTSQSDVCGVGRWGAAFWLAAWTNLIWTAMLVSSGNDDDDDDDDEVCTCRPTSQGSPSKECWK